MERKKPNNSEAGLAKVSDAITVREAGARGGQSTFARRGAAFFREIGAKGGKRQKELYSDLLSEFGKLGGRPKRPNVEDSAGEGLPEKRGDERSAPGSPSPA